ncbi:hypothetical protein [Vibrio sp. 10N.222.51.C5]|uniref:hypothetical protein n=1 Tax=Vibrio sp. 10N.222.51.C5 TaxID=3229623 RepID=UPI0035512300
MMKSLVDLQNHLNKVYAELIYGKSAKCLTASERKALEIVFKVEQGSSNVTADLGGFFTELGKTAMEKMTGKQVVTVVLGVAAIWAVQSTYNNYLGAQSKDTEAANKQAITMALIQNQPQLKEISEQGNQAMLNVLRSVPDATQVSIDKTTLSKAQIEAITHKAKQESDLRRLDGEYKISLLKHKPNSYRVELLSIATGETIGTELFKGHLSISEMTQITNAFVSQTAIRLNVAGRVNSNSVVSANIVGVNNQANGDQVDQKMLRVSKVANQTPPKSSN